MSQICCVLCTPLTGVVPEMNIRKGPPGEDRENGGPNTVLRYHHPPSFRLSEGRE